MYKKEIKSKSALYIVSFTVLKCAPFVSIERFFDSGFERCWLMQLLVLLSEQLTNLSTKNVIEDKSIRLYIVSNQLIS